MKWVFQLDPSEHYGAEVMLRQHIAHDHEPVPCHAIPPHWLCNVCGKQLVSPELLKEVQSTRPRLRGMDPGIEVRFPAALENGALVDFVARTFEDGDAGEFYRAESRCKGKT